MLNIHPLQIHSANPFVFEEVCRQVYRPAPASRMPRWLRCMWVWL